MPFAKARLELEKGVEAREGPEVVHRQAEALEVEKDVSEAQMVGVAVAMLKAAGYHKGVASAYPVFHAASRVDAEALVDEDQFEVVVRMDRIVGVPWNFDHRQREGVPDEILKHQPHGKPSEAFGYKMLLIVLKIKVQPGVRVIIESGTGLRAQTKGKEA